MEEKTVENKQSVSQPPQKEQKKEKPKDDWKLKAEAKKLKKQQDRQKEKEKQPAQKTESAPADKPAKTKQPKIDKSEKLPHTKPVQSPTDQKMIEVIKPALLQPSSLKQTTVGSELSFSKVQSILPRRLRTIKNIKPDQDALRNVLLQHTSKYFHGNDSVLIASQHQVCKQWFDLDVCEVVDIWDLCEKSSRKENIIRTRFQDVSHLLHTTTKIVCGATAIFQNGVVLSEPGTQFLALLAYEFGIPFIVFCETYRYCDVSLLDGDLKEHEGTLYDLINPKYISMLITEAGPITVCSIPTLVSALYGL